MMNRHAKTSAAVAGIGAWVVLSAQALACGVCIEDKVAVTYDHAVIQQAAARHHVVVFAAIEGSADGTSLARQVKAAAARTRGVDRGTIRAAATPCAVSFAVDPKLSTPESAITAIERSAGAPGVKLSLLRTVP